MFWVKRNPKLMFMGGFHSFPGGQLDPSDAAVPVVNSDDTESAAMRACATREFFEEAGVLLARGAEALSTEQIASLRRVVMQKEKTFNQIFEDHRLEIDASLLIPSGRWVTPPFAPRRFDTWFFLRWLEEDQEPQVIHGELESGEWIRPADALERWNHGEIIMAPPTLHIIRTLARFSDRVDDYPEALTAVPEAQRGMVLRIEFFPGIFLFPVKTNTLPPATHTNCYIVGDREVIVIDPASPFEEEQRELASFIDTLIAEGRRVKAIYLTHHHSDHIGGVDHLRAHLNVPVIAHEMTAERVRHSVTVDQFVEDDTLIELEGDPTWRLRVLHTPGHARGHLCFYDERTGAIITGDLVVGIGTVVIDPPEGNMQQYFDSLRRLLALPKLASLFGAHGPAIGSARHKIEEYIAHRSTREDKIFDAVKAGAQTTTDIVAHAYTDVSPSLYWLAERSTVAHLEKLEAEGKVMADSAGRYAVG